MISNFLYKLIRKAVRHELIRLRNEESIAKVHHPPEAESSYSWEGSPYGGSA